MARSRWWAPGLVTVMTSLAGCDEGMPASPLADPGPYTVSGVVYGYSPSGRLPLASLAVNVRISSSSGSLAAVTDANGRYSVSGVPVGVVIIEAAESSGYVTPCPSGTDGLKKDRTFDVHVVSVAVLTTTGTPTMPTRDPMVSGRIFEETAGGALPIAGASVALAGREGGPALSSTLSDASGRYLLCTAPPGVGTDALSWIGARKDGFVSGGSAVILGFDDGAADVELVRR